MLPFLPWLFLAFAIICLMIFFEGIAKQGIVEVEPKAEDEILVNGAVKDDNVNK